MKMNSKLTKRLDTLVETMPAKKLAMGYLQYEILSNMTPKEFTEIFKAKAIGIKGTKLDEKIFGIGAGQ